MNKRWVAALGLALLSVMFLVEAVGADSPAAAVKWQVFSGGGAPATGGTIALDGSLGQPAIGVSTSLDGRMSSGYWYFKGTLGVERRRVYLPIVVGNQ